MKRNRFGSWIVLVAALLVVAALRVVASVQPSPAQPLDSNSARPDGALALRLWLQQSGYVVSTASTGATLTHSRPSTSTLLLLGSASSGADAQTERVLAWVKRGGHLVVASEGEGAQLLATLGITLVGSLPEAIHLSQPILASPPVRHLAGLASLVIGRTPPGVVAATTASGPVLLMLPWGAGRAWVLTAPRLLDNAAIADADNRRLLLNLVGPPGTTVLVATPPSASEPQAGSGWLTSTVWGATLLFLFLVAILYRWLSGWRLGPPTRASQDRQRPASEYVVSLAGLLRRAGKRGDVLRVYQRQLQRSLQHGQRIELGGIAAPSSDREVDRLLAPVADLKEADLVHRVEEIVQYETSARGTHA